MTTDVTAVKALVAGPLPLNVAADRAQATQELCEYCCNASLVWRKCKQLCTACGHINRSCADL